MSTKRTEINLSDVVKNRVEAGKPIFITGNPPAGIVEAVEKIATESGKPAQIVQVVDLELRSNQK